MAWLSIALTASAAQVETLSDALMSVGALSVSIEDLQAGTDREQPIFGEPGCADQTLWHDNQVVALFDPAIHVATMLEQAEQLSGYVLQHYQVTSVDDQDWVRTTQAEFAPIHIHDKLWIVPSWHVAPDPEAINIKLDPGLAFGTGSHPTTRLCLQWLMTQDLTIASVLDYGCGSGIIAIVASKLGADYVMGIDIDPLAVSTAQDNAVQNEVRVHFTTPQEDPEKCYDIVVANILTNPLRMLAPLLAQRCLLGGRLVLSGILTTQADMILAAYQRWFEFTSQAENEGWICLVAKRVT